MTARQPANRISLQTKQPTARINKLVSGEFYNFAQYFAKPSRQLINLFAIALLITGFVFSEHAFAAQAPDSFKSPNPLNELTEHSSPYLAMHGQDPVNWRLWNADILQQAQQQNKLIFVSSGYFSCHWCHVMHQESYLDSKTAEYLNEHFISVKIDRELNPETDKALIEFARLSSGQAGWPQHIILTPKGYGLNAFIYLNNSEFNQRLKKLNRLWHTQDLEKLALQFNQQAMENSRATLQNDQTAPLTAMMFKTALYEQLKAQADDFLGGLKTTRKFPQAPLYKTLLLQNDLPEFIDDWVQLTLQQMQNEHLFDHIHGGFYRYTTDPNWQIPHFEKMLYDNAQLAEVFLLAFQRYQNPDFLQTATRTLAYIQDQLYDQNNQLYLGSQSALDHQAREGGDYLWSKAQLKQRLNRQEFALINQAWQLDNPPPYEIGWHPKPIESPLWPVIQTKLQGDAIATDSKNLLGWNGLMLSALSRAYAITESTQHLQSANQLAGRLLELISLATPPRAISRTDYLGEATLQDYAFIYQGIKDWQQLTKAKSQELDTNALRLLRQQITTRFLTTQGWHYNATPILPNQQGEATMPDSFIPSPTALVNCLSPQQARHQQGLLLAQAIDHASYLVNLDCD